MLLVRPLFWLSSHKFHCLNRAWLQHLCTTLSFVSFVSQGSTTSFLCSSSSSCRQFVSTELLPTWTSPSWVLSYSIFPQRLSLVNVNKHAHFLRLRNCITLSHFGEFFQTCLSGNLTDKHVDWTAKNNLICPKARISLMDLIFNSFFFSVIFWDCKFRFHLC